MTFEVGPGRLLGGFFSSQTNKADIFSVENSAKKIGGGDYILQDFFFHFNQEWDGLQMSPQVHPALHGGLILCKMFIIVQCFASTCTQYLIHNC